MSSEFPPPDPPAPTLVPAPPRPHRIFQRLAARYIVPATTKPEGVRLVFDLETDGFADVATCIHCIVVIDLDSDRIDEFGPGQIEAGLARVAEADVLVGHNIINFDLSVLRRRRGWSPAPNVTVIDTLIASRLILANMKDLDDQAAAMGDPKLGKHRGRHSLAAWGARFGTPKVGDDIEIWAHWTPEMQERCVGDARITKTLFHFLQPAGQPAAALELEQQVTPICDAISAAGIPFHREAGERLRDQWEVKRAERAARIYTQFPELKNINSKKQLTKLLLSRGWIPEKFTKTTAAPSLDAEVLESIGVLFPEFEGLSEHAVLTQRLGLLANGDKAWLKSIGEDGRIHSAIVSIGTPNHRAAHFNPNIAQVPQPKRGKPYATECRSLFQIISGDWVFVACDQAGLQDRAFAHYLAEFDGGTYARAFVGGLDTHWASVQALNLISSETTRDKQSRFHSSLREGAKSFRYGFLFGAQNERAGIIIHTTVRAATNVDPSCDLQQRLFGGNTPDKLALIRVGGEAKTRFEAATPGLRELRQSLERQVEQCGWIPGLDGRRVPVGALYKVLNYAVTSAEAVICKRWLINVYDELCERFRIGWDGDFVIAAWVHDEIACCCRPEIADEVGAIMVRWAIEAGERYGLKLPLAADYTIGRSWAGEPISNKSDCAEASEIGTLSSPNVELSMAETDNQSPPADKLAEILNAAAAADRVDDRDVGAEDNGHGDARHGKNHRHDGGDDRAPWATPTVTEIRLLSPAYAAVMYSLRAEERAIVWPTKVNGGAQPESANTKGSGQHQNQHAGGNGHHTGNGRDHHAGDDDGYYGERTSYSQRNSGKPYAAERSRLQALGYMPPKEFPYALADGTVLFWEARFELLPSIAPTKEKPRKQVRIHHLANGQDVLGVGTERRVIYNWGAVMRAGPGAVVLYTEGAPKSQALIDNGLLASAVAFHSWKPECVDAARGQHVIFLADHPDPEGRNKAETFAADARKYLTPVAASFRTVPALHLWRNLGRDGEPPASWDVKDWLAAGGEAAKLVEICQEVPADADFSTIPLTLDEWFARDLPELDPIMGEVLTTTTRGILHANTGIGKSIFGLDWWGHAAAGKSFLHWHCPRPRRMLFIDGEMSRRLLRERLEGMVQRLDCRPPWFLAFNREDIPGFAPLNTREGQAAIWSLIEEAQRRTDGALDAVCFDNIMSLITGDMKEEDSWRDTLPLIQELTRRRTGQLWVHHTGHDASRGYGTKTREWLLDVVIHLDAVQRPDTDVSFTLSFPKARERSPRNREDFAEIALALIDNVWISEAAAGTKEKVSPMGRKFFEALQAATRTSKITHIGGCATASLDEWQAECIACGLLEPAEKAHSARTLFHKYRRELIAGNWITTNTEVAWILP
jgi:DNA polymerase I-like protein with 3'-5' exonuclease and polymerase domains